MHWFLTSPISGSEAGIKVFPHRETVGLVEAVPQALSAPLPPNVAGSQADTTVDIGGVRVIGAGQLPASVPQHASALYARNVSALLEQLLIDDLLTITPEDPLLDPCLITHAGTCRRLDLWPALVEVAA